MFLDSLRPSRHPPFPCISQFVLMFLVEEIRGELVVHLPNHGRTPHLCIVRARAH